MIVGVRCSAGKYWHTVLVVRGVSTGPIDTFSDQCGQNKVSVKLRVALCCRPPSVPASVAHPLHCITCFYPQGSVREGDITECDASAVEYGRAAGRDRGRAISPSGELKGQRTKPDGAMAFPERKGFGGIQRGAPPARRTILFPREHLLRDPRITSGGYFIYSLFPKRSGLLTRNKLSNVKSKKMTNELLLCVCPFLVFPASFTVRQILFREQRAQQVRVHAGRHPISGKHR